MTEYISTDLKVEPVGSGYWASQPIPNGGCRTELKKIVMVESDKVVAVYEKKLVKGVSKNGIPWSRWTTEKSDFYSMKTGTLQSYSKGKTVRRRKANLHNATKSSYFPYYKSPEVCQAIDRLLVKNGKDPIKTYNQHSVFEAAYPLFKHWAGGGFRSLGVLHMGSQSMQEFTLKSFGKTRYRKDLVRAVAEVKHPIKFKNAYAMRGLVPIDWIIAYFNADNYSAYMTEYRDLRGSLKKMTMQQRKSIITVLTTNTRIDSYVIEDLFEFVRKLPEEVVQSIKIKPSEIEDAHMKFSAAVRKMTTENTEIKETMHSKFISGIDWSDTPITMKAATQTHEVVDWGIEMGHCIGGYARDAAAGHYTLTGIYKDGKLIGNAMFRERACVQIFGQFNKQLPDKVLKSIIEKMEGYRFDNAWGIPLHLRHPNPITLEDDGVLVGVPF